MALLVLIVVDLDPLTAMMVFTLISFGYITIAFNKLLTRVEINTHSGIVKLSFIRYLFLRENTELQIADVDCSYQIETRSRGMKVKVLRIKNRFGTLLQLVPIKSGWSHSKLEQIYESLHKEPVSNSPEQ